MQFTSSDFIYNTELYSINTTNNFYIMAFLRFFIWISYKKQTYNKLLFIIQFIFFVHWRLAAMYHKVVFFCMTIQWSHDI